MERHDRAVTTRSFKIVYVDIDGTIIDGNQVLSARTRAALLRVSAEGRALVLCTGRSRHAAEQIASQLGCHGYGIVLNGALTLDWRSGRILRAALVPGWMVEPAATIAAQHGLACVWLGTEENDSDQYVESGAVLWPQYEARNRSRIRVVRDLAAVVGAPASLVAYGTEDQTTSLARAWQAAFRLAGIALAGPTAAYGGWYAQLTSIEADKAAAAAFVAAHLKVPAEQTLSIGDHRNDVSLLRWSGMGVCMADGDVEARSAADYITGTIAEDGAALALERFVLNPI